MIGAFEQYHGAVLRELIVGSTGPILIEASDDTGRINSYRLNGDVALHVKHSSKRLAPWQFTFNDDNLAEIGRLAACSRSTWLALVCGYDGILALTVVELQLMNPPGWERTCFVRVDRDRRTMYRVNGSGGPLSSAKPRGLAAVIRDASTAQQGK